MPISISYTLEHRSVLDTTCSADFPLLPESESSILDKDKVVCNACHLAGATSQRPFRQTNRIRAHCFRVAGI